MKNIIPEKTICSKKQDKQPKKKESKIVIKSHKNHVVKRTIFVFKINKESLE